jgi:hypothetical protein
MLLINVVTLCAPADEEFSSSPPEAPSTSSATSAPRRLAPISRHSEPPNQQLPATGIHDRIILLTMLIPVLLPPSPSG